MVTKRQSLVKEIRRLQELLLEREAALPAHSVRPHQIQEIEALEEKIVVLKRELTKLSQNN